MSLPKMDLTDAERYARKIAQAAEAKRKRVELKKLLTDEGRSLCKERLCIKEATAGGLCSHHSGHDDRRPKERACLKCNGIAVPGGKLCGYHQEESEERSNQLRSESRKRNKADLIAKIRGAAA